MKDLKEMDDVTSVTRYPASGVIVVEGTKDAILALSQHKDVSEMHSNRAFKVDLPEPESHPDNVVNRPTRKPRNNILVKNAAMQGAGMYAAKADDIRKPPPTTNDNVEWNIEFVNADKVWDMESEEDAKESIYRGAGTIYANADTGKQN